MARHKLSFPEQKAREAISKNLKRYSFGMTQRQLSERTGIPTSTISGYFAKRSTPNAGNLQKLADALNVKKSDIDPRYKSSSTKQDSNEAAEVVAAHIDDNTPKSEQQQIINFIENLKKARK